MPHWSFQYLTSLGIALVDHHRLTNSVADLEEAIPLLREAHANLTMTSHTLRHSHTMFERLVEALQVMFEASNELSLLQEAVEHCESLLKLYYTSGHRNRAEWLRRLTSLLRMHFRATGCEDDLSKITAVDEELEEAEADRIQARPGTDSETANITHSSSSFQEAIEVDSAT